MPDPANPRGTNPLAIAARNQLYHYDDPDAQRSAAFKLLTLILGNNQSTPRIEPPPPGMFQRPELMDRNPADLPPVRISQGGPLDLSSLSPEAQAAWITLQDARPRAVNKIASTGPLQGRSDIAAFHRPFDRRIEMGERHPDTGAPLALKDLLETLTHELSHAVGVPDAVDKITTFIGPHPVSAYDVGDAAREIHRDINLPQEDELVRQKHIQMLRKK